MLSSPIPLGLRPQLTKPNDWKTFSATTQSKQL
eukprot:COSAG06_NODE_14915_length_1115_cov_0.953740_2_plen_32_part_01